MDNLIHTSFSNPCSHLRNDFALVFSHGLALLLLVLDDPEVFDLFALLLGELFAKCIGDPLAHGFDVRDLDDLLK